MLPSIPTDRQQRGQWKNWSESASQGELQVDQLTLQDIWGQKRRQETYDGRIVLPRRVPWQAKVAGRTPLHSSPRLVWRRVAEEDSAILARPQAESARRQRIAAVEHFNARLGARRPGEGGSRDHGGDPCQYTWPVFTHSLVASWQSRPLARRRITAEPSGSALAAAPGRRSAARASPSGAPSGHS